MTNNNLCNNPNLDLTVNQKIGEIVERFDFPMLKGNLNYHHVQCQGGWWEASNEDYSGSSTLIIGGRIMIPDDENLFRVYVGYTKQNGDHTTIIIRKDDSEEIRTYNYFEIEKRRKEENVLMNEKFIKKMNRLDQKILRGLSNIRCGVKNSLRWLSEVL